VTTLLFTHPACAGHSAGPGHPESPVRLEAIRAAVDTAALPGLARREAPLAARETVALLHPPAYVEAILAAVPAEGYVRLDPDTLMSPGSGEAALRASGAAVAAVDAVLAGEAANAFCAIRPPGHHAEPDRAMGFCLFNHVAIAARHARARHGLRRIAIVDFDVHHGNGTQAAFWNDPDTLYVSTHQWPLYPGTGAATETGVHGTIVNVPLSPGTDGEAYRRAVTEKVLPVLDRFAPELVLLSAGFDAHRADPLASLALVEDDFAWITAEMAALAARHARGRVVSLLEGGYDPGALGRSVVAHLRELIRAGEGT